jgi:hypothetical protein
MYFCQSDIWVASDPTTIYKLTREANYIADLKGVLRPSTLVDAEAVCQLQGTALHAIDAVFVTSSGIFTMTIEQLSPFIIVLGMCLMFGLGFVAAYRR